MLGELAMGFSLGKGSVNLTAEAWGAPLPVGAATALATGASMAQSSSDILIAAAKSLQGSALLGTPLDDAVSSSALEASISPAKGSVGVEKPEDMPSSAKELGAMALAKPRARRERVVSGVQDQQQQVGEFLEAGVQRVARGRLGARRRLDQRIAPARGHRQALPRREARHVGRGCEGAQEAGSLDHAGEC